MRAATGCFDGGDGNAATLDGFTADELQPIDLTRSRMKVGRWYGPVGFTGSGSMTVGRLLLSPIVFHRACTLDRIACSHTTTVASSVARLGIYSDDGTGWPGNLLLDAGTVVTSSGSGPKEIAISQAVSGGLYWTAFVSQGGASGPTFKTASGSNYGWLNTGAANTAEANSFTAGIGAISQDGVAGALPATFSGTTARATGIVSVQVRASA